MLGYGRRRGQGLTEYLIIVVLVAIALIVAVGRFGGELDAIFQGTQGPMTAVGNKAKPVNTNPAPAPGPAPAPTVPPVPNG
ncbi:MAG: hypothetical protein HY722_08560 [Planctomycetes bacterium]|nr:hypothetical protein [Planctomycetota bacterium]